jgi:H+-translocating NAD(P) transhydrogenase subunit alpha
MTYKRSFVKPSLFKRFAVAFAVLAAGSILSAAAGEAGGEAAPGTVQHASAVGMDYIPTIFVFMLSTFVGLDIIRRVSRLLHTPLMSLTNAISAIAVVGSILIAGQQHAEYKFNILGMVAIVASVSNIVSGFLITDRMLKMFKRREGSKP